DRLRGGVDVARQGCGNRAVQPCRIHERPVGARGDGESWRHRDPRREHVAEIRALAAEVAGVGATELGERAGVRHYASRTVTTPLDPSTRSSCPVSITAVA